MFHVFSFRTMTRPDAKGMFSEVRVDTVQNGQVLHVNVNANQVIPSISKFD